MLAAVNLGWVGLALMAAGFVFGLGWYLADSSYQTRHRRR